MSPQIIGLIILAVYMVLAWVVLYFLNVQSRVFYMCLGAAGAVGAAAYMAFLWIMGNKASAASAAGKAGLGGAAAGVPGAGGVVTAVGSDAEIDGAVRDADARLAGSRTTPGAHMANLPAVFVIGDPGSAKTTSVANCGLEVELLAGQVYHDNNIIPTRSTNIWLGRQSVWVDAGGTLLQQPPRWARLIKKLTPGKMKDANGATVSAPRAALVCFDMENFTKAGAADALAGAARNLQARLGDISQQLGISFPVYVLFTRCDRLPFFLDFVRNLSNDEGTQVFGMTVPIRPPSTGVYNEEETRRLTEAFNMLVHALCDKRIMYLPRENDGTKLPGAYEFPREFRKVRGPLVQFLVDLCRPSQLRASPFLRGFYFSGVRPVFVNDAPAVAAAPQAQAAAAFDPAAGATRIFKVGIQPQGAPQGLQMGQMGGVRKVPQWVFLTRLFNDVILGDRDGMALSAASTKTSKARRIIFASAAVLSLILLTAFTISFVGNNSLANQALDASKAIAAVPPIAPTDAPPVDSLKKLESLRQILETLTGYKQHTPWSLRWGLYEGDTLYPEVRRLYYKHFDKLLFGGTKASMLASMQKLPPVPGPTDEYGPNYDTLKAYLIVTSHHDKSTREFLSPYMMARWSQGRTVDQERAALVQKQFDFYSEDLRAANPYTPVNDSATVERTRIFLSKFSGIESIYKFMLSDAARKNPLFNFNKVFPGSEDVVVNNKDVSGAFTKAGWGTMQNSIKNASKFFSGEEWVLGNYKAAAIDPAKLEKDLSDRYTFDFIAVWRQFLRNTIIVKYKDVLDASKKLNQLSGNTTPLMALFWSVTQNTSVDSPRVTEAFDSAHKIVPPPATAAQYIYPNTNGGYITALTGLQSAAEGLAQKPNDQVAAQSTLGSATSARLASKQLAQTFRVDQEGQIQQVSQKLLEDPITYWEALVRGAGRDELNAKGGGLCKQCAAFMGKFPFKPDAKPEATLGEVARVFRPGDGALWEMYESGLKKFLKKEGGQYVAIPDPNGAVNLNPAFVKFFNDAAQFSEALYPGGAQDPQLKYTLQFVKTDVVQASTLTVNGQTTKLSGNSPPKQQYVWPGMNKPELRLKIAVGGVELGAQDREGTWAVFRFFADADNRQSSGSATQLEWVFRSGKESRASDLRYRFTVEPEFFTKEFLANLKCNPLVAR